MFPEHLNAFTFYQKKRDIIIYKARDDFRNYILKCIITENKAAQQAFYDEYTALAGLSHPAVPVYYGLREHFILPESGEPALALCMEYCEGISLSKAAASLTLSELLAVILSAGKVLTYLLEHGILYTDLHPDNLLLREKKEGGAQDTHPAMPCALSLIDYTYCYCFLNNPNPSYPLRFSYDLSPDLKGQQLLIQELTFLTHALLEIRGDSDILPFSLCTLLETGTHPAETLSLSDFLTMLEKCIR